MATPLDKGVAIWLLGILQYPFEGMPQKGHLRICVLTTSAMSHQAVLEKMHIASLSFFEHMRSMLTVRKSAPRDLCLQ